MVKISERVAHAVANRLSAVEGRGGVRDLAGAEGAVSHQAEVVYLGKAPAQTNGARKCLFNCAVKATCAIFARKVT